MSQELLCSKEEQQRRYDICKRCPNLRSFTKMCKVCNCVMPLKTRLQNSSCPIGHWGKNSWGS